MEENTNLEIPLAEWQQLTTTPTVWTTTTIFPTATTNLEGCGSRCISIEIETKACLSALNAVLEVDV